MEENISTRFKFDNDNTLTKIQQLTSLWVVRLWSVSAMGSWYGGVQGLGLCLWPDTTMWPVRYGAGSYNFAQSPVVKLTSALESKIKLKMGKNFLFI